MRVRVSDVNCYLLASKHFFFLYPRMWINLGSHGVPAANSYSRSDPWGGIFRVRPRMWANHTLAPTTIQNAEDRKKDKQRQLANFITKNHLCRLFLHKKKLPILFPEKHHIPGQRSGSLNDTYGRTLFVGQVEHRGERRSPPVLKILNIYQGKSS